MATQKRTNTSNISLQGFSRVKEAVAHWADVQRILRSGDDGYIVPVVIPKSRRGYSWVLGLIFAGYLFCIMLFGMFIGMFGTFGALDIPISVGSFLAGGLVLMISLYMGFRGSIVEIEQGTVGIYSEYGEIKGILEPGPNYLWWPFQRVEYIVDTSTEIPYTAPVLACPTQENVPLKSIEFFLKFRIVNPVNFVRRIGASNFDIVLSSMVQDAIRRRSRFIETAKAYDLRGSDVHDMTRDLNRQLEPYGVRIIGANIPDVQLPDQYQNNLATRERVNKELSAYEKEWELIKKRRQDNILMEIERAKKEREEKIIAVKRSVNEAKERVAQMLQEKEAEAEKIRLDVEAEGKAKLKAAENEARALNSMGQSYKDNHAVLKYELRMRGLDVAQQLLKKAPRPIIVNSQTEGNSAISTLILARMLPEIMENDTAKMADGQTKNGQESHSKLDNLSAVLSG